MSYFPGSTDIDMPSSLLHSIQNQMQSKGGYEMAYGVKVNTPLLRVSPRYRLKHMPTKRINTFAKVWCNSVTISAPAQLRQDVTGKKRELCCYLYYIGNSSSKSRLSRIVVLALQSSYHDKARQARSHLRMRHAIWLYVY